MTTINDEYLAILDELDGDNEGRLSALHYLEESGVDAHGEPLNFSYFPYLVDEKLNATFEEIVATTHTILTKIIRHYIDDAEYRALFKYSKQLEDLIMMPCDYSQLLPMARFDIFIDEQTHDFKFCEFNTDGTSCMSRDLILGEAVKTGAAFQKFAEKHDSVENYELFDSWAKACLDDYRECSFARENALVVVADFMNEHATFSDFDRFAQAFERQGVRSRVVDIRDLKFDGERLYDANDGETVDCVYRRAVTCDIQNNIKSCQDFIDAVAANKVCLVGHFRTTVVHTKTINVALFLPETREFLTQAECDFIDAHCPRTYRLKSDMPLDVEEIIDNPTHWILKPEDDYGAKGVFAGPDFADGDEWKRTVESHIDAGYVAQEYAQQHTTDVMFTGSELDNSTPVQKFNAMPGLYSYNGKFAGIYLRCGNEGVIAVDHNGLVKPAFKVDC
ncbi:MAG: hypothetical protein Q3982_00465 [Phoenicibacter congonensis]|uniref:Glutathionylspermidine synthase pre-ATP-grasp-like domain-containing protein n=1 Tax=Phoenicibacter congonensis TaxID=1944646 RepID=A0AA43UAQ7_9ACTN|nr:hypothetical protein [Phoenicibacter congonensis]